MNNKVKVILEEGVDLPEYETELAVGVDVRAVKILTAYKGDKLVDAKKINQMNEGFIQRKFIKIRAFERILFGTGIRVELPANLEIQVRPRSGLSLKKGLAIVNSPGTVDADYRGEIGVILVNLSPFMTEIAHNERIAQFVTKPTVQAEYVESQELSATERGEGGFGSTDACGLFMSSNTSLNCDNCGRHQSEHVNRL